MVRRLMCAALAAGAVFAAAAALAESHPSPGRPEIRDVGDPILITRKGLSLEMKRNSDLRDWVRLYGPPDYAEVQQIEIDPPWAPYEVRLYYLDGNSYLAFCRANVAPSVYDYGVRKYQGVITSAELDRLLTAQPAPLYEVGVATTTTTQTETEAPEFIVETIAVDGKPVAN
jgi:hypothetical protein